MRRSKTDGMRGSAKMYVTWQPQYKRRFHQRGPGADFLRGVSFWHFKSAQALRVAGAALGMTWLHSSVQGQDFRGTKEES